MPAPVLETLSGIPDVKAGDSEAFITGSSPTDFPEVHYERSWPDRFHEDQLNHTGRRGLGLG